MRVIVAMSGGVDSSVAAARLVQAGHDVVGVTLRLGDHGAANPVAPRLPGPEMEAEVAASLLGIAHHVIDFREEFDRIIVSPFVDAYLAGFTPSPCVVCNRRIKLAALERVRRRLGADAVATGHYARLQNIAGRPRLLRARDLGKDQSYFLHALAPEGRARLLLPLGDLTKSEVRADARRLGLPSAERAESQELCFVPDGRYVALVEARGRDRIRPGPLVDASGREVGRHRGIHAFTLGQRRQLGVALGSPVYVTGIEPESGCVRLGSRDQLASSGALLEEVVLDDDVELPLECEVVVRYRAEAVPARAVAGAVGSLLIHFSRPVAVVAPGQYAVLYLGERVLGGGRIRASLRGAEAPGQPGERREPVPERQ